MTCRFSFDYSLAEGADDSMVYFYSDARIVSDDLVTCDTPDVSSLNLFDEEDSSDYVDCFVTISEIDG